MLFQPPSPLYNCNPHPRLDDLFAAHNLERGSYYYYDGSDGTPGLVGKLLDLKKLIRTGVPYTIAVMQQTEKDLIRSKFGSILPTVIRDKRANVEVPLHFVRISSPIQIIRKIDVPRFVVLDDHKPPQPKETPETKLADIQKSSLAELSEFKKELTLARAASENARKQVEECMRANAALEKRLDGQEGNVNIGKGIMSSLNEMKELMKTLENRVNKDETKELKSFQKSRH